jgi:7,8-dihydropterin-6-yl-methyl-4-(beta-D-ribofuranosyl)aminobenzene 5'-phosphate synthase
MIIKALAENTSVSSDLGCEHGLSLYIETPAHKILFDTGESALFSKNALVMNIDLRKADIAFISHGHYDHGGGLKTFLSLNDRAKVYISSRAFNYYYADFGDTGVKYIGLSQELLPSDRFVYVDDMLKIDDTLELFSAVRRESLNPAGNADLLKQDGDSRVCDDFAHEQNLVIRENGRSVLISGCAHCGIVNILAHFYRLYGHYPDTVVGGFHLYNPARDTYENPALVKAVAEFLVRTKAQFYTCHCTGIESFKRLKEAMGDQVAYLSGGQTLQIHS